MKANHIILALLFVTGAAIVVRQFGGRKNVVAEPAPVVPASPAKPESVNQGPFHAATMKMWQDRLAFELAGHEDGVLSLAFSPDGKYLASASADRTVRIWDIAARKEIRKLQGHADIVNSVSYSPDGRHILSTGRDNAAIVWDAATGEIANFYQHYETLRGGRFLAGGRLVTITENHVALWSAKDLNPMALTDANETTWQLDVSPNGEIAAGNVRGEIEIWDGKTLERITQRSRPQNTNRGPANCIYNLHYLDSHRLLITDVAGEWIWNRTTDVVEPIRSGSMPLVLPLQDSGLFAGTDDYGVWYWDGKDGEAVALLSVPFVPRSMDVTSSGKWLAVGGGGMWLDHLSRWVSKGATAIRFYDIEQLPAYAAELTNASPSLRPKKAAWIANEQRMVEQGPKDFPSGILPWE